MNRYDYIIVGAGSAGSVLANRLTEDADVSVLVLEAGQRSNSIYMRMPLAYRMQLAKGINNWNFQSEPEPFMDNRRIEIPRGKALGGSSAINGMLYLRGHPRDYDLWRQSGCEGWSYADVLPYFKKAENSWRGENEYHGASGPLGTSPVDITHLRHDRVAQSAQNAGFPLTDDFAGDTPEGLTVVDMTVHGGERASTFKTYLLPAMARPNLTVETGALTKKIEIEQGRATGVTYIQNGNAVTARAEREVILSGGSYNSPQILMLSGIGPADELAKFDIPVVHELPGVGRNLSEHPAAQIMFDLKKGSKTFSERVRLDRVALSAVKWQFTKKGDLATQPLAAMMFIRSLPELERPDLQIFFPALRLDAEVWFPFFKPGLPPRLQSNISLQHPESRGTVTLRSDDPADHPRIQFNMFERPEDLAAMRRGIRLVRKVYAAPPLGDIVEREVAPGVDDDEGLDAFLRKVTGLGHHPVGTCAMGQGPDAVVDPNLRMHGIAGLRIVDASIMPTVPGGNTNAPTIMIAERAADLIKAGQ